MKPLGDWPQTQRHNIVGVLTDIDDTLTTQGQITPDALQALANLQQAGLHVFAITGRPIGWCETFVRGDQTRGFAPWPVDAFVAENGAVAWVRSPINFIDKNSLQPRRIKREQLSKIYQQSPELRATNHRQMQAVMRQISQEVPNAKQSQDTSGRETDIAIDHSEFTHLSTSEITQVVRIMQTAGMKATVSSIHINGWFGEHNKLTGARWIVREMLGRDIDAELDQWVYIGDSTNDQVMFAHFPNSVGVANISRFTAELAHLPRYVTPSARGAGFAELAQTILAARQA